MQATARKISSRQYAHPLDKRRRDFDSETHGVGRSSDAIDGYYGIGWYEYFEDRNSGEVYQVHCSDGVYGGKGDHSDEDERWIEEGYRNIMKRTQAEASECAAEVRLSRNEWVLMQKRTHSIWLDPQDGEEFARQADCSIEYGLIGHIQGVPVIVDLDKEDELPPR